MNEECPYVQAKVKLKTLFRVLEKSVDNIESFSDSSMTNQLDYLLQIGDLENVFSFFVGSVKKELIEKIHDKEGK